MKRLAAALGSSDVARVCISTASCGALLPRGRNVMHCTLSFHRYGLRCTRARRLSSRGESVGRIRLGRPLCVERHCSVYKMDYLEIKDVCISRCANNAESHPKYLEEVAQLANCRGALRACSM